MRVLVLSFYYEPDLCAGSFRTTALVKELSKSNDVQVEVISTLPNRYSSFSVDASEHEVIDNIIVNRIAIPSHNSGMFDQAKAFFTYYRAAMKIADNGDYDFIFATSSRLFTAFLASRIARKKKLPLYLDIRDIFVDTIKDLLSPKLSLLAKPVFSMIERYSFSRAQRINLVSGGFREYFLSRYPSIDFREFTNGIDSEFLGDPVRSVNTKEGVIRVLYAGNIGEGQGLHEILPKLSGLMSGRVVFTVIGSGGRQRQLKDSIKQTGVTLIPPMNRQRLIAEYGRADVLFLHLNDYPAFKKVLPSKIFEYAALGKPILAGVSGYAAEFLQREVENSAVFYPGDEIEALTAFEKLKLVDINRVNFKKKFARQVIMTDMKEDLIEFYNNAKL